MDDSPIRATHLLEEYFPGSLIGGKYELEEVIGRGGMGSVWRANNVVLDMPVAIKLIRPEVRGADTTALLLNEARLAAKLQHPSIVRLFDFGVAATGDAFIVMELLQGPSLAELLAQHGSLPAVTAVRLLLPIVHGLAAAHRRGIVHLDLKPENIILAESGARRQPKLLDFGIATKAGLHDSLPVSEQVIGSPAYMSPERACGRRDVDARADIWAMCVVLYELVAGRGPFTEATASDTIRAVMENDPAPLFQHMKSDHLGTRALWSIVEAGLVKERGQRLGSARQLGQALAQWLIARGAQDDICGELLVKSWGLQPRAALPKPANDAIVEYRPTPALPRRWRAAWVAAAAGLSVAVPALLLVDTDATPHVSSRVSSKVDAGITQLGNSQPLVYEYREAEAPLTAAQQRDSQTNLQPPASAVAKPSPHTELRTAARLTKPVSKRPARARSREAALGLKDPFE